MTKIPKISFDEKHQSVLWLSPSNKRKIFVIFVLNFGESLALRQQTPPFLSRLLGSPLVSCEDEDEDETIPRISKESPLPSLPLLLYLWDSFLNWSTGVMDFGKQTCPLLFLLLLPSLFSCPSYSYSRTPQSNVTSFYVFHIQKSPTFEHLFKSSLRLCTNKVKRRANK